MSESMQPKEKFAILSKNTVIAVGRVSDDECPASPPWSFVVVVGNVRRNKNKNTKNFLSFDFANWRAKDFDHQINWNGEKEVFK